MPKASDSSATVLREDNYNVFTVLVWIMITMATRLMITAYFILFRLIRFANKYLTPYRRFFPFLLTSLSVTFISHTYLSKKKKKRKKQTSPAIFCPDNIVMVSYTSPLHVLLGAFRELSGNDEKIVYLLLTIFFLGGGTTGNMREIHGFNEKYCKYHV